MHDSPNLAPSIASATLLVVTAVILSCMLVLYFYQPAAIDDEVCI